MSVIASEIFEKLAYSMEPATMTACIMETLEGARREDVLVGVCFLELGRLVELRYAAAAKTGNFYGMQCSVAVVELL